MSEKIRSTIQKRDATGAIRHGRRMADSLGRSRQPEDTRGKNATTQPSAAPAWTPSMGWPAAARALSGIPELQIVFSGDRACDPACLPGVARRKSTRTRWCSGSTLRESPPAACSARCLCPRIVRLVRAGPLRGGGVRSCFPGVRGKTWLPVIWRGFRERDLMNAHLASLIPLGGRTQDGAARHASRIHPNLLLDTAGIPDVGSMDQGEVCRRPGGSPPGNAGPVLILPPHSLALIGGLLRELGSDDGNKRRFSPTGTRGMSAEDSGASDDDIVSR
jgi:hypothetical protein